jgi:hypothetical protein
MYSMASHIVSTDVAMITPKPHTFCQNLPLAGLAPWRVGQNPIELIKQILHLAPPLSFGHLVTDTELGSSRIVATAGRSWVFRTLKTRDVSMLHRMVMSSGI